MKKGMPRWKGAQPIVQKCPLIDVCCGQQKKTPTFSWPEVLTVCDPAKIFLTSKF
jgi:hypothetical protein